MNPWFIWKGKNSLADFGLWINKLPRRVRAEERHEEIEIPGRAGSLLMLEGDDVYSSYTAEMTVIARNTINVDRVVEWLRGSSDLVLSTDIDKARPARIVGEVAFERVGNNLQQATIPFVCQPFRKRRDQLQDRLTFTENGTIRNPGDVASKPKVSITRSGNINVTIGGSTMSFTGVTGTIVVDCEAEIVTKNGEIWTGSYTGDFWKIPVGSSAFERNNTSTIVIDPNWGWL